MPKTTLDTIDKVLIKFMDFLEILATFSQEWKIEEFKNFENLAETLRKDIFYGLVVYDLVRFTGINKMHHESADFNWN